MNFMMAPYPNSSLCYPYAYPFPPVELGYYPDRSVAEHSVQGGNPPGCSYPVMGVNKGFAGPVSPEVEVPTVPAPSVASTELKKDVSNFGQEDNKSDSGTRSSGSDKEGRVTKKSKETKPRKAKRKCLSASSRYKGVSWHKRDRCYMARVWVDGTSKHVGSYQQEMRAALAVDYTLLSMGKDASHLNFPLQLERDIAASILKHQTVSQNISKDPDQQTETDESDGDSSSKSVSEEDTKKAGVDRNGFPNCVYSVLGDLLTDMKERRMALEKTAPKSPKRTNVNNTPDTETKTTNPKWDTLLEVASNQPEICGNDSKDDSVEKPAGDSAVKSE